MSRRRRRPGGGIVGGTARYVANPVNFDGTNDYLTRGAGLTGEADSKLFSGSVWARRTSTGTLQRLLRSGGTSDTGVNFHQTDLFQVFGRNAANDTTILNLVSSAITDALWHHYMWSVDLSDTAKRHLYVDGVSDFTSFTHLDQAIDFTHADWGVGATDGGVNKLAADVADMQVWFGKYIDLSLEANRRLFITPGGRPVDPAIASASALGTPIILLSGDTDTWHTNGGTGGGFTENGALTDGTGPVEV